MEKEERIKILNQILWDYTISVEDVDAVLRGDIKQAGHYNQEMIFLKILESYSWFTILQLFNPNQIKPINADKLRIILNQIADDFLFGKANSLGINQPPIQNATPIL
jgi:hypothetical protein